MTGLLPPKINKPNVQPQNSTVVETVPIQTTANSFNDVPNLKTQPIKDTVNLRTKAGTESAKKGLSKTAKWTLGAIGAVAVIGLGFLGRVKIIQHSLKKFDQLAEHIDFKPGETLEEAIAFGKSHLGIKEYKGFEAKDVDLVNWLNEGYVNISNMFKGKTRLPKTVKYTPKIASENINQCVNAPKRIHSINKDLYDNLDKNIKSMLDEINSGNTIKARNGATEEELNSIVEILRKYHFAGKKNPPLTFKEKINIFANLEEYANSIVQDFKYQPVDEFGIIYHEYGHLIDKNMVKFSRAEAKIDPDIAGKVSFYAQDTVKKGNNREFVAEVIRRVLQGHKLDDDVIKTYEKLGAPALPV